MDNVGDILVVNCQTLGEKVKIARTAKRLRQIDVASQTGVNVSDVINLEKNRVRIIAKYKVELILKLLGIVDGAEK